MNLLSQGNRDGGRVHVRAKSGEAYVIDSRLRLFDVLNSGWKGINLSLSGIPNKLPTQFVSNSAKHHVNQDARFADRIARGAIDASDSFQSQHRGASMLVELLIGLV